MSEEPPARPTKDKLRKLIAIADDVRGNKQMRRAAKRILERYARYYPDLVRVKHDPSINRS